jgi:hypothetical protein
MLSFLRKIWTSLKTLLQEVLSMIPLLKKLFDEDSQQFGFVRFEGADRVDRPLDQQPLADGRHYIRLRLAQMFLKKRTTFLTTWYPAVHSVTQFTFVGDQQVSIPMVADATRVGMTQQGGSGDVVARNFVLSPTTPFNGGIITLDAGLIGIQGQNLLDPFLGLLSSFSSLLVVPQLSAVLSVAGPLARGVQEFLTASNGKMHLGYHDTFAGGEVKAGYIAIIHLPQDEIDPTSLYIVDDQLRKGSGLAAGQNTAYADADYMLLRLEIFEQRDDWEKLTTIDTPRKAALQALAGFDEDKAKVQLTLAKLAAMQAPELTKADRRRVIQALDAEYQQFKHDIGIPSMAPRALPELNDTMQNALSVDQALALGEPTWGDILS